jgi:hypothetical protein
MVQLPDFGRSFDCFSECARFARVTRDMGVRLGTWKWNNLVDANNSQTSCTKRQDGTASNGARRPGDDDACHRQS